MTRVKICGIRKKAHAIAATEAGADFIMPSEALNRSLNHFRKLLDQHSFESVGILAAAATFASALFMPFQQTFLSKQAKSRENYQINPANAREAVLECMLNEQEGADMLLIQPAISSLDILLQIRQKTLLPIGAFQISGEWAMIQAAAERGWINKDKALIESLLAIKRAGADFICTYGAKEVARLL